MTGCRRGYFENLVQYIAQGFDGGTDELMALLLHLFDYESELLSGIESLIRLEGDLVPYLFNTQFIYQSYG